MRHPLTSPVSSVVVLLALLATTCTGANDVATSTTTTTVLSTTVSTIALADVLADLPEVARASNGGGDPRPPGYWAVWNTCAPDNRAAEAAANGGRAAGWLLVDDVLADPGIGLGDHLLASCEESVALLQGVNGADGEETSDPAFELAGQLLAAELNLTAGAETCPVADEAVVGAHLLLSTANFDGVPPSPLDAEAGGAVPQLIDLLEVYNAGELCR